MGHSPSGLSLSQCGSSTSPKSSGLSLPQHGSQSLKGTFSSTECFLPREHLQPRTQQCPLPQVSSTSFSLYSRHVSSHLPLHVLLCPLSHLLLCLLTFAFVSPFTCPHTRPFVPPAPCHLFMSFFVTPHVSFSASLHGSSRVCPYVCPFVSPLMSPFCDSCP